MRTKCAFVFSLLGMWFGVNTAFGQYSQYIEAVDEYCPAPGQFTNVIPTYADGDTPETMAAKCTEAIGGDVFKNEDSYEITLGGWGGYVVFHFDHPVANVKGQRDFAVWGNAFTNSASDWTVVSAEPAIVMVSVDENGNGLPDDEWYELAGSEYNNPQTIHNYEVSYEYAPLQDVRWTDNQGNEGTIDRNRWHMQEYFPLWLKEKGKLTFSGARLPNNAYLQGITFILPAYDWGYADNQCNWTDVSKETLNAEGCGLDIGWAVDADGQPVELSHIDFVKCYNAMNQKCGDIGETSTEIAGAEDLHLEASVEATAIRTVGNSTTVSQRCYSLDGRMLAQPQRGLNIVRTADGKTRKVINQK